MDITGEALLHVHTAEILFPPSPGMTGGSTRSLLLVRAARYGDGPRFTSLLENIKIMNREDTTSDRLVWHSYQLTSRKEISQQRLLWLAPS
jgi:hypothetical protein